MSGGGGGGGKVKETAQEKALSEVTVKQYNRWNNIFKPMENKLISKITGEGGLNSAQAARDVRGVSSQATAGASKSLIDAAGATTAAAGVNPNSGRAKSATMSAGLDAAKGAGDVVARAGVEQQDRYTEGLQSLTAMGQGQESQAIGSMGGLADSASRTAIGNAEDAFNSRQGTLNAAGTVAGLGTAAYLNKPAAQPAAEAQDPFGY